MESVERNDTLNPLTRELMPHRVSDRIRDIVGERGLLSDPGDIAPYLTDWRGAYKGKAALVVRPASTAEVSGVLTLCHQEGIPVVTQGGNTGLCGGSMPDASGRQIVLSLNRLNRIRDIDAANDTLVAEAGCVLADVQNAAREVGRLFPLSMGSEGSCTIGGNLATNAGGIAVLRYGNMRDLTLGIEVVLPDGRIWDGLRALRKDNTGYDLKHLFIGSEGSLGVITAAVLKLYPLPTEKAVAFAALPSPEAAIELFKHLRSLCGARLTGFELMSRMSLDFVLRHMVGSTDPMEAPHPWYLLIELTDSSPNANLRELIETGLIGPLEDGRVLDAVIAADEAQAAALWKLREGISEAQNFEGPSIKHDIAVPVGSIPGFIDKASAALSREIPGIRLVCYGHVGDGNLHFNLSKPPDSENADFRAQAGRIGRIVYDVVAQFTGSISAEHGLGQSKRQDIVHYKSGLELELMRSIKALLDPKAIINPGKVLPD